MTDYAEKLAKEVLDWYNIRFSEDESSITIFVFTKEPMTFTSWEDVLAEMLFTMEESNNDAFDECGEHLWNDQEIMYVRNIAGDKR